MEIQFQLPIMARGTPKGRKSTRSILATVAVSVDIDEANEADLEPVASFTLRQGGTSVRTDYYFHGDGLCTPLCAADEIPLSHIHNDGAAPHFVFESAARTVRRWLDNLPAEETLYPLEMARARKASVPLRPSPLKEASYTDIHQEGIDIQVEEFRARCARLLVAGGKVYLREKEPMLAVALFHREGFATSATVKPIRRLAAGLYREKTRSERPHALFHLGEMERLRAFCVAAGADPGNIYTDENWHVSRENGGRLVTESERATLYASALRLTRTVDARRLPDHPAIDELWRLVDHFTEEDCTDEIGDALRAVWQLHHDGEPVFPSDFEASVTGHVLDMWEGRTIAIENDLPAKPRP